MDEHEGKPAEGDGTQAAPVRHSQMLDGPAQDNLLGALAIGILGNILARCNDGESVTFTADWGGPSLTVETTKQGHTHCGLSEDEGGTFELLAEQLYGALTGGQHLSFVKSV